MGRATAGSRSRSAAATRPSGPRRDEAHTAARRVDRRAAPRVPEDQPLVASWDPQPVAAPRRVPGHAGAGRGGSAGRLARLVSTYGWRVYALPVLLVLTVLAVLDVTGSPVASVADQTVGVFDDTPDSAAGGVGVPTPLIPNPGGGSGFEAIKASAELPGGGTFTVQGAGTWRVVPGAGQPFGTGQRFTYTVEIEDGVVLEGGPEGFATTVDNTLNNRKSWIGSGHYQFQRIDDSEAADLRISLTSQLTTRAVCGFKIPFDASCWKGGDRRVVINVARWVRGAVAFQGNVVQYEQYVVNHEVGHGLGFPHTPCDGTGKLAPVMMQQTWGVANDYLATLGTDRVEPNGQVCAPNAWPFPTVN